MQLLLISERTVHPYFSVESDSENLRNWNIMEGDSTILFWQLALTDSTSSLSS